MRLIRRCAISCFIALLTACAQPSQRVAAPATTPAPHTATADVVIDTSSTPIRTHAEPALRTTAPAPLPAPTPSLWDRIRTRFALASREHPRIDYRLAHYSARQEYLDTVVESAEPYLYFIADEVERRDMPAEIVLLPIVESAYKSRVEAPGNTAGLWQFTARTGRNFGLAQSRWYDGRRDVEASTTAALDYLEKLHADFDGDWLLALAAYNSGEGTVRRAIEKNRRAGKSTDYWHLDLPEHTRAYIPKLMALSSIVADPESHGVSLKPVADEPYLASVEVNDQIDLRVAADLADMPLDDMLRFNAGYTRKITPPDSPARLLLPLDRRDTFLSRLSSLPAQELTTQQDAAPAVSTYTVKPGESLWLIARRFKVSLADLRKWNRLGSNPIIRPGQQLTIHSGHQGG
jgi:membrane-bound lytic murein transglycosylase D